MGKQGNTYIGTSGWYYDHWKGPFYPGDLPKKDYLGFYQNVFSTVELKNVFDHLPTIDNLFNWYETVPDDFLYAVKASRYITHVKRLKSVEEPLAMFMDKVEILGDKLGPILFQLPPLWECDLDRLIYFLQCLPKGRRYVFEFRDQSWFNKQVFQLLRKYRAASCLYHLKDFTSPKEITGDFVYIRLHGSQGAYNGEYDLKTIKDWATQIIHWAHSGLDVYCYFDNDEAGYAAKNALSLKNVLSKNEK